MHFRNISIYLVFCFIWFFPDTPTAFLKFKWRLKNVVTSLYVIIWSKFPLTLMFATVKTANLWPVSVVINPEGIWRKKREPRVLRRLNEQYVCVFKILHLLSKSLHKWPSLPIIYSEELQFSHWHILVRTCVSKAWLLGEINALH